VLERRILRIPLMSCVFFGAIKVGYLGDGKIKFAPEYKSCKKLATSKNIPLRKIYQEVYWAFEKKI